jgi:hypothetical protein
VKTKKVKTYPTMFLEKENAVEIQQVEKMIMIIE